MAVEFAETASQLAFTVPAGDTVGDAIYALVTSGFSVEAEYGGIRCQSLLTSSGWLFAGKTPGSAARLEYSNILTRCQEVPSCLESSKLPTGTLLDGRLFSADGDSPLRRLTRRDQPSEPSQLRLAILDVIEFGQDRTDQWPLDDRRELLQGIVTETPVVFIPTWRIGDDGLEYAIDLLGGQDDAIEGVALRRLAAPYGSAKSWLVHRRTETYRAVVMAVAEGRGKLSGMAGSLVVGQFRDGELRRVASVDSMAPDQRHYAWRNRASIVGRVVSFVSQGKIGSGYRRPRLLCFLSDVDPMSCLEAV